MSTWILVADTSRARIFNAEKSLGPMTEIRALTSPEARLHEGDLVSSEGERERGPNSSGGSSDEERTRKHENAERFAAAICSDLDQARNAGQFRKLYVVAPPAFLGMLRRHQSNALRQTVAGELDKNLSIQDPNIIRKNLPDYL